MPPIAGAASVRLLRQAVSGCVAAATAQDAESFDLECRGLNGLDQQRLRLVQSAIILQLLQDLHPQGLSGEDARQALEKSSRSAAGWYPDLDPGALATVLLGALGAGDPADSSTTDGASADGDPADSYSTGVDPADGSSRDRAAEAGDPTRLAAHGCLLISDLLAGNDGGLDRYLDLAFAEIQRAETMEMP